MASISLNSTLRRPFKELQALASAFFPSMFKGVNSRTLTFGRKAGGPNRAYIETVPVEVTNGDFRIVFTPQVENPAIKAIELIPQAEAVTGAGPSAATIRIKAGLSSPFTDSSGQVWQPDTGFEGGMMSQVIGGLGGGPGRPGGGPPRD